MAEDDVDRTRKVNTIIIEQFFEKKLYVAMLWFKIRLLIVELIEMLIIFIAIKTEGLSL